MGLAGGAGSQFGIKKESSFGTAVAVDRFHIIENESIKAEQLPIMYRGIGGGGGLTQHVDMYRQIMSGGSGATPMPVTIKGMGTLLEQIFGDSTVAQVSTTDEYTQTHVPDVTSGKYGISATAQVGRAMSNGTVVPFTYSGGKVTQAEFACDQGGFLMVTPTWAFREERHTGSGAYALQTVTYPAGNPPFDWAQGVIDLNETERVMKQFRLTVAWGFDLDRRGIGSVLRREPVPNGELELTGNLDAEFENVLDYEAFVAGEPVPLVVTFDSGIEIGETGNTHKIIFDMPAIVFTGETPNAASMELLRQPLPYKVMDNGSDPMVTVTQHTSSVTL